MERFTLFAGDREFELTQLDTLRELLQRKLISPRDKILFEGEVEPVEVSAALEGRPSSEPDVLPPPDGAADDLWAAWSNTDSFPVDGLVSELLGEVRSVEAELSAPEEPVVTPRARPAVPQEPQPVRDRSGEAFDAGDELTALPEGWIEDLPAEAIGEMDSLRAWEPLTGEPAPPRPSPPSTQRPTGAVATIAVRPSTFVEFVQQRKAAGMDLEIQAADGPELLRGGDAHRRIGAIPVIVGLLAILVFAGTYGTVRTGANRQYPTESEIRARLSGGTEPTTAEEVQPTEAPPADDDTPAEVDDDRRESRLRSSIPVALQSFKNVEDFENVLFTDITNAGVKLRHLEIDALVVAPLPDAHRQRPEEVNALLRIDAPAGVASEDALALAILVLGHYGADAHVRFRRVVIHVRQDVELATAYEIQGDIAVSLFERKMDLGALLLALEQGGGKQYLITTEVEVVP